MHKVKRQDGRSDWADIELGDYVSISSGVSPSRVTLRQTGRFPYVKVEDLNNSAKYQSTGREFTDEPKGLAPARSLIFPKRGAAILNNKIRISVTDLSMDSNLMAVLPNDEIDLEFFFYTVEREGLFKIADTSTIPQLNNKHINPYVIALPPLPEQRRIAEILRTWDEAIEELEALRAAKDRRCDALTYSMVFGARQFLDFVGQGRARMHRWFDLPSSWDCKPVGEIAAEMSERNGDGEHEVLSCSKYDGFVRSLEYFKKQVFSSDLSGYKVIRRGEFGFPSNHVEEGSIGLQNLVDTGLVSPIYTVFRFDPEVVDNEYAFAVLKTSSYRHIFEVSTSSSVDRRGSLRWSEFSKIPFPLPPLEEQRAIMAVIRAARADVQATMREITALQRQKRGLMQKLLTGEWRVSVDPSQSQKDE